MNHNETFNHILRNIFRLLGFIVIGIFLNLMSGRQHANGALQGSGLVRMVATVGGSYSIPILVQGTDVNTGQLVNNQQVTITYNAAPPITCSYFTATPSIIFPPQKTQLKWNCPNATTCSITRSTGGTVTPSPAPTDLGTTFDAPAQNTTYTLICNNIAQSVSVSTQVQISGPSIKEVPP